MDGLHAAHRWRKDKESGNYAEGLEGMRSADERGETHAAMRMRAQRILVVLQRLVPFRGHWSRSIVVCWWYHVKSGFAWPVDYFTPSAMLNRCSPSCSWGGNALFGGARFQGLVKRHHDRGYDIEVASNKRRAAQGLPRVEDREIVDPATDLARRREV
jgi:hypothetical protein